MKKLFPFLVMFSALSALVLFSGNDSSEHCIIDRMVDAKTNTAAYQLLKICRKEHRSYIPTWDFKSYFYRDTFNECVESNIGNAQSEKGAFFIRYACKRITAKHKEPRCYRFLSKVIYEHKMVALPEDLYEAFQKPQAIDHKLYSDYLLACKTDLNDVIAYSIQDLFSELFSSEKPEHDFSDAVNPFEKDEQNKSGWVFEDELEE